MELHASHNGSWSQTGKWVIALGKIPDQATSLKDADRDALVRAIARQISRTMFGECIASSLLPPTLASTDCAAVAGGRLYSCAIENRIHFKFYPRQNCTEDEHDPDHTPPHKPSPRNTSADEFVRLVVTRLRTIIRSDQEDLQTAAALMRRHSKMPVDVLITSEFKLETEALVRSIDGRTPNGDRNNMPVELSNLPPMYTAGGGNPLIRTYLKRNIVIPLLDDAMCSIYPDEEYSDDRPRLPEPRHLLPKGLMPELLLPYVVQTRRNQVRLERWL